MRRLVKQVDANNNGELDFAEFVHLMSMSSNRVNVTILMELGEIRDVFAAFDADGSGERCGSLLASCFAQSFILLRLECDTVQLCATERQ